jgi:SAM-dependent methyltransferase
MSTWKGRIASALTPPPRISVREFLEARAAGCSDVEDTFFWQIRLHSGVYKATHRRRFDDTFPLLLGAIAVNDSALRVLDVACSSGVSTAELHRALVARGLVVETIGTDILTRVKHVAFADGSAVLVDRNGNILGAEIGGMLIDRQPSRAMMIFHPLRVMRSRWRIRSSTGCLAAGHAYPPGVKITEVPLTSSSVDRLKGVRVVEEDILEPRVEGSFGLIRAANILNFCYFAPAKLRELVAALIARLRVGGILFIVRSEGTVNHGTLWFREIDGLRLLGSVGRGSEISGIVEEVAATLAPGGSGARAS